MCGIAGLVGRQAARREDAIGRLRVAREAMLHRGPDGGGEWIAPDAAVGFSHRRLAVIDPDEDAAQPMVLGSGSASVAITFNGEVFNYRELRARLDSEGIACTTTSDTEVLLRLCRHLGVPAALEVVRGMFAFAYYDGADGTVWLARDRFGEKPLYYTVQDGTLGFASELRGLRAAGCFRTDVDPRSVDLLMRRSCIGGTRTIYRDIAKLLPGHVLRVPVGSSVTVGSLRSVCYWDPVAEALDAAREPFGGDLEDACDELDDLLGGAVVAATVSDVPIGAFLSAGLDSTSVVSQMVRRGPGTVRTYTIGFPDGHRSEADEARGIAEYLGTDHTELVLSERDLLDVVPTIPDLYDEPFADSSQIPTFAVSRLARTDVTVALTGDGGDELFAGYHRYARPSRRVARAVSDAAAPLRARTVRLLDRPLRALLSRHHAGADTSVAGPWAQSERIAKLVTSLERPTLDGVYDVFVSTFNGEAIVPGVTVPSVAPLPAGATPLTRMLLADTLAYLPDDLLTKVDRAAMAVSLETRVPMLSPELFRFVHRLAPSMLISGGEHKVVLRRLLARHVPRPLWDHPKQGFGVPIDAWLRGPLSEWADDLLAAESLGRAGLVDADRVQRMWIAHRRGSANWGSQLWNVLTLQAWLDRYH
ncbi:MAG: asparagine synthase (glutamine-hydrolyzing) [Microthrixaceae bacterium]